MWSGLRVAFKVMFKGEVGNVRGGKCVYVSVH